jgi:hypothetical protein
MKKIILFLILFFPLVLTAQQDSTRHDTLILDKFFNLVGKGVKKTFHHVPKDTIKQKQRQKLKLDFSFESGTQYNSLLRDHHFPMDTIWEREINIASTSISPLGRVGITYKPSFGFHTALSCDYTFKRSFKIESGLQLSYRQVLLIEDTDTAQRNIVNNFNFNNFSILDTFKSFQYSYFDIIVPLYFGYSYKRFNSFIGLKFPIFTFARSRCITLHDLEITRFKSNQFFYDTFVFSLKFEYLILNKKYKVSSFLVINDRGRKYYDFLLGLKIKLNTMK